MEPIAIAAAIATLFTSEAIKAGGKSLGEGTSKLVGQLLTVIRNKFKASGTEGILAMVEEDPKVNIDLLTDILLKHITKDEEFANQLRELLTQTELKEEVRRQIGAENIKVVGDLEVKGINQETTGGKSGEQIALRNVEAGGSVGIGEVNQKS